MNKIIKNKFLFLSVILVLNSCSMLDASSTASKEDLRKFDLNPDVVEYVQRRQALGLFTGVDKQRVDEFLKFRQPIIFKIYMAEDIINFDKIFKGLEGKVHLGRGRMEDGSSGKSVNFNNVNLNDLGLSELIIKHSLKHGVLGHLGEIYDKQRCDARGNIINTLSYDFTIRSWNFAETFCLVMIGHEANVTGLYPFYNWLVSFDANHKLFFWNAVTYVVKSFDIGVPIINIDKISNDTLFITDHEGQCSYFRTSNDDVVPVGFQKSQII